MDPSFYSPQPTAKTHAAVCYCRAHGTIAQGYHETSYGPPSPITRQLIQQHPQAVVIQHGLETTLVPCQVVYHHHQPVYGYMAHNTLDGATAIARQRRSQSHSCQDPRCCQSPSSQQPQPQAKNRHQKSMKSRKSKSSKNAAAANAYKSAPSSPVGTPKRLVNMVQATSATPSTTPKKSLPLNPQWITAFPTIETPSESGYPALKTTMTGCCGKRQMSSVAKRRQRSNSYSALDSTSDDGQVDYDEHTAGKGGAGLPKRQVSECVKNMVSWMNQVGDKVGKGTSALIEALPSLKEDHHVVMVGLDSAGKSTVLYRLKFDQYVNTVPTIGFNCERVRGSYGRSRGLTFLIWDVGGQEKVRPLWKSYTRATDAVIFVVDSTDVERLEEAKLELHRIMRTPDNVGVPLLVIANKQDLPSARSPSELEKYLALSDLGPGQLWHLEAACAVTGEGLDTALEAIHDLIGKKKKQKKRARNKTR